METFTSIAFCFKLDSTSSGGDGMYTMMKTVPGGAMPGVLDIPR